MSKAVSQQALQMVRARCNDVAKPSDDKLVFWWLGGLSHAMILAKDLEPFECMAMHNESKFLAWEYRK